jgi:hypothetical protein
MFQGLLLVSWFVGLVMLRLLYVWHRLLALTSLGLIDVRQVSVTNTTKHVPSLSPADTKPRLHISISHKVCRKCPAVFEFCHLTGPIPSKR